MVDFQVEFLKTLEDGIRLVPNLDRLEKVEQFKVAIKQGWFRSCPREPETGLEFI